MYKLSSYVLFLLLIVPPCLLFVVSLYGDTLYLSFGQRHLFKRLRPEHNFLSDSIIDKPPSTEPVKFKYILTWCEAYEGKKYGWAFGPDKFREAGCPESRCFLTSDRTHLGSISQFDAIMFHQRSFSWSDAPPSAERRPEQRYVHWMFESPSHLIYDVVRLSELSNFFNWSMSYRLDSTFPVPYGSYENIKPHPSGPELSSLITKFGEANTHLAHKVRTGNTSQAAWFVSNCNSKSGRENAVKELKKHFSVDVYGAGSCSDPGMSCPRSQNNACLQLLNTTYKFYLSLENSLCGDYVTEKLWKVLDYNVIPVVLNGANMTNIGPPNSYIDFKDFNSTKELADYLLKVSEDDQLFASYFWWRDFYTINTSADNYKKAYCSLCEALHDQSRPKEVITDMEQWWELDAKCHKV